MWGEWILISWGYTCIHHNSKILRHLHNKMNRVNGRGKGDSLSLRTLLLPVHRSSLLTVWPSILTVPGDKTRLTELSLIIIILHCMWNTYTTSHHCNVPVQYCLSHHSVKLIIIGRFKSMRPSLHACLIELTSRTGGGACIQSLSCRRIFITWPC